MQDMEKDVFLKKKTYSDYVMVELENIDWLFEKKVMLYKIVVRPAVFYGSEIDYKGTGENESSSKIVVMGEKEECDWLHQRTVKEASITKRSKASA